MRFASYTGFHPNDLQNFAIIELNLCHIMPILLTNTIGIACLTNFYMSTRVKAG